MPRLAVESFGEFAYLALDVWNLETTIMLADWLLTPRAFPPDRHGHTFHFVVSAKSNRGLSAEPFHH
jgi:hypothetical protein